MLCAQPVEEVNRVVIPAVADATMLVTGSDNAPKMNLWCIDGAATSMAIWNRPACVNIRSCMVQIFGSNSDDAVPKMMCTEIGDVNIRVWNRILREYKNTLISNVLIHESFPFNIFSETSSSSAATRVRRSRTHGHFSTGASL